MMISGFRHLGNNIRCQRHEYAEAVVGSKLFTDQQVEGSRFERANFHNDLVAFFPGG